MPHKKIDKYVINFQKLLGKGNFAEVYLCTNQQTKTQYAVKIVAKSKIQHDEYLTNALRHELAIHNNLRHQNIVSFVEVFETGKNFYIIQQYCNGGNIRNVLQSVMYKRFQEQDAIQCLESVCRSYEELLKNAVLHRYPLIKCERYKTRKYTYQRWQNQARRFWIIQKSTDSTPAQRNCRWNPTLYVTPNFTGFAVQLKMRYLVLRNLILRSNFKYIQMLYGFHPWVGNTQLAMINNIKNQPLKFPKQPQISQNARNFIQRALKMEESDRITWLQIFEHPLFQNRLQKIAKLWRQGYKHAAQKLDRLRPKVSSQQLTGVFFRFQSNTLNFSSFSQVIKWLIKQMLNENALSDFQIAIMYQMFDKDLNGVIDLQEFVGEFQVCDPRILKLLKILIENKYSLRQLQNRDFFYRQSNIILEQYGGDNIQALESQILMSGGYKIVSNIVLQ